MTKGSAPFDQHEFVRLHPLQILPLVIRVELDTKGLSIAVGVFERGGHEVVLDVDAPVVAEGKRPVPGGMMYGPPEVDDLEAALEERGRVGGGEVSVYAGDGGGGGLVDVDLGDGLAFGGVVVQLAGAAAPDS